jgi:hypothetical protein
MKGKWIVRWIGNNIPTNEYGGNGGIKLRISSNDESEAEESSQNTNDTRLIK